VKNVPMADAALRLIPLGGLGEFGLNALVLECAGRLLLVDAGVMFPPSDLPGVDSVVPDFDYLAERREALEAIVLTHAHEDHIGALSYALQAAPAPVYGGALTLGLAERRLVERGVAADLRPFRDGQALALGPFRVHPIRVAHSVPDSHALAIETPAGVVIVTGDFKLAQGRPDERTDVAALAAWGDRGVLALLSDSTNVEVPGRTPSEDAVLPAIETAFATARGRVLVSCFATSLPRIQRIAEVAARHGRRLAFAGRRVSDNAQVARDLGFLSLPTGSVLSADEVAGAAPAEVALIVSGSQGEPLSALSLISVDDHKSVHVAPGDIVLHSARIIPGNERAVARVFDNLYRRGCDVVHGGSAGVHVSGHGGRDDLAEMIALTRPRHFVPVHGEYRLLVQHARLAVACGLPPENALLLEDGQVLALDASGARREAAVPAGRTLLDRSGLEEIGEVVVRDRRHLSSNGIVVPVIVIEKGTGRLGSPPEIVTRGLVAADNGNGLVEEAGRLLLETCETRTPEEHHDSALLRERVRVELGRLIKRRTQRRPLVVPVVMEV
jgi:ribonuclease J